jgi:hypothetical protein
MVVSFKELEAECLLMVVGENAAVILGAILYLPGQDTFPVCGLAQFDILAGYLPF